MSTQPGLPIASIPELADRPLVNGRERFLELPEGRAWVNDFVCHESEFDFDEHWKWINHDLLFRVFSFDEIIWQWFRTPIESKFDRWLYEADGVLWKLRNALWHYGYKDALREPHALYLHFMAGLRRLHVDLPGFELRLTHSTTICTAGTAVHLANDEKKYVFLDAPFGILLFYKGEFVMTIGFAPSHHGILVAQVQLRHKRGNRFLYKLPMHHVDFAIDILARAFPDDRVGLVTGESTVEGIKRSYKKNIDKFDITAIPRILELYNRPLSQFTRTNRVVRCGSEDGREFAMLQRAA